MKRYFYFVIMIIFLFSCTGIYRPEDERPAVQAERVERVERVEREGRVVREERAVIEEWREREEMEEITEEESIEEELIEEELIEEEIIEEELIEEEITENIIDINNELTERITDLEQQVIDLQAQLSQLLDSQPPVVQPPEPPPQVTEVTVPEEVPPQDDYEITETEEPIDVQPQPYIPPVFAREEQPVVTPSTSIIVPREPEPGAPIIFSRVVRATRGQIIEIPFRGTGWVYLGEIASRRGIAYDSRRNDPDGLSFIFRAEEAGTYALKFSRHDFIRDYILNDHVQVIVGEAPDAGAAWFGPVIDRGRVVAEPRWPSASEEAEILRGESRHGNEQLTMNNEQLTSDSTAASVAPSLDSQREPSNISEVLQGIDNREQVTGNREQVTENREQVTEQEVIPFDQFIPRAKELFDEGNAAGAIALLDRYKEVYPSGTDELYWLYGQFYEANTPSRNILLSIDYYKKLTQEFPQSSRYNDARRRIAYLERFYINIQ